MAEAPADEQLELMNEQAVAGKWSYLRSELNQLHSKITEMDMELSEHSLVIGAIQNLDPSRKCFRMIGGVLVERTVAEVLPAVLRNREGLQEVITRLNEAQEKKRKELAEFESKYKIKIRRGGEGKVPEQEKKREGAAQGVLVGPAK
ncbi:prefoldin subunit 2 [Marchantia polymorpha subsp. ruderalis]|uniref:Prefoldin subunit 2 n=2 Tax=Marchantia polymorpha TaxID=3197 RepID=A0AAF6B2I0_MARPO|nr:hypothetical protein MARPO_0049s0105 [Marchantia polymorpha]BBN06214.1 hypothetical protein Mp_3g19290 [Marchantia polymorpha subsp. ruderalis]PTQ38828.1 hypothetical protein MARPO_0049s0105 [Marchantia polymorpha]PTQ38829.1 hypothetical protein MARPO_0049s0105 [Marchantia polymorpha]BBN06215.1 hypothetical protein Mp_3g19290 [Marchantia polymorpha subsp. ruderalis]|eukprot:PTQ38827.1 hypothetical protein MARPO_0049s0105 [Marchantia polymorpha]